MNRDKKIFFTDLDETLLTTQKTISPATAKVLMDMAEAGHYIVLASGRTIESLLDARRELPISDKNLFYASCNGSRVVDASTGATIREERMSLDDAEYFINYCENKGIAVQSYDVGYIVTRKNSPELDDYRKIIHMPYKEVPNVAKALSKPPFKCLALNIEDTTVLDRLAEELAPWAGDRISLVKSSPKLLEAFSSKSGKGSALTFLADYLGIPIENTMAAGDQGNDISMLKAAGTGVAMINGAPDAKAAADIITREDNNHDGLVPILREFFGV